MSSARWPEAQKGAEFCIIVNCLPLAPPHVPFCPPITQMRPVVCPKHTAIMRFTTGPTDLGRIISPMISRTPSFPVHRICSNPTGVVCTEAIREARLGVSDICARRSAKAQGSFVFVASCIHVFAKRGAQMTLEDSIIWTTTVKYSCRYLCTPLPACRRPQIGLDHINIW